MFQPHWCFSLLLVGCYSIGEWSQNGLWEPSLCPQGVYIHRQSRGRGCWTSELPAVQACREQTQNPKQLKECFCLAPHGAPSPFTFLFELHHLPLGTQWSPWTATLGSGTVCARGACSTRKNVCDGTQTRPEPSGLSPISVLWVF